MKPKLEFPGVGKGDQALMSFVGGINIFWNNDCYLQCTCSWSFFFFIKFLTTVHFPSEVTQSCAVHITHMSELFIIRTSTVQQSEGHYSMKRVFSLCFQYALNHYLSINYNISNST